MDFSGGVSGFTPLLIVMNSQTTDGNVMKVGTVIQRTALGYENSQRKQIKKTFPL